MESEERFDDTNGIIRIRKSKKDRQHNGQKKKDRQHNGQKRKTDNTMGKRRRTDNTMAKKERQTTQWTKEERQKDNQRSTKHTHKIKVQVIRTALKIGGELRCSGMVNSS